MISVDEDFFILVRVAGAHSRVLLSDVTAATDWPVARSAVEFLDIPLPDDEDDQEPAGDLGIVADLGVSAMDMGALLDDFDLYPDEMLGDIASKIGFGAQFDEAIGVPAT
jgi:putative tRNA adenosine deaminase-associated protein